MSFNEAIILATAIGILWATAMTAFAIWSKVDEDKEKRHKILRGP
ncbi:MAG: hypothetical protein ACYDEV_16870 [Acidiferrobacter sp.]